MATVMEKTFIVKFAEEKQIEALEAYLLVSDLQNADTSNLIQLLLILRGSTVSFKAFTREFEEWSHNGEDTFHGLAQSLKFPEYNPGILAGLILNLLQRPLSVDTGFLIPVMVEKKCAYIHIFCDPAVKRLFLSGLEVLDKSHKPSIGYKIITVESKRQAE